MSQKICLIFSLTLKKNLRFENFAVCFSFAETKKISEKKPEAVRLVCSKCVLQLISVSYLDNIFPRYYIS